MLEVGGLCQFCSECQCILSHMKPLVPYGAIHPQEAKLGSNGILKFLSKLKHGCHQPTLNPLLANVCMSGQPISTCHALTS